jgi:tRNA-intron endonuclease, archaea type
MTKTTKKKTKTSSEQAAVAETSSDKKKTKQKAGKTIKPAETSENQTKKAKKIVLGFLADTKVITESSDDAREFYNQSRFGAMANSGKVELSLLEAFYLMDKGKLDVKSPAGRKITFESYLKKARKIEPNFWIRYCVFKDMRNRGYIIKTALKFGADFRVYDRGIKPGEDHARWIIYPVHEGNTLTWYEFAAKNRVAHSTKKRLLMGIVDDEGDVTYYEIKWVRP